MARGGFLGRIGRAIRNIIAPPPPPPPREPPPPPREPPPEPPEERGPTRRELRDAWRDQGGRGNYRKNLKLFNTVMKEMRIPPEEQLEVWESYVRNMTRSNRRFRFQDINNPFWRETGIDPRDFDWQAWRQAMGYTGKRRSRTP